LFLEMTPLLMGVNHETFKSIWINHLWGQKWIGGRVWVIGTEKDFISRLYNNILWLSYFVFKTWLCYTILPSAQLPHWLDNT
jgi:hypothetical protein